MILPKSLPTFLTSFMYSFEKIFGCLGAEKVAFTLYSKLKKFLLWCSKQDMWSDSQDKAQPSKK